MSKKDKSLEIAKECLLDEAKEADEIAEDILIAYDEAAERLKADIQKALIRFADQNDLSIDEANRILSRSEYSRWKQSIGKYLQEIKEGADSKMLLELNTLSAKSSISRKEQLLAQIDKEMSRLAIKLNKDIRTNLGKVLVNNCYEVPFVKHKFSFLNI